MKTKVGVVVRREFLTTIKRKSYLITTLGMPLFFVLIAAIGTIPALFMAKKGAALKTLGIVDRSGLLGIDAEIEFSPPPPPQLEALGGADALKVTGSGGMVTIAKAFEDATRVKLRPYASREAAEAAVRSGAVGAFFEFPADYLDTGQVLSFEKGGMMPGTGSETKQALLRRFVIERLLAGKLDEKLLERVRRPLRVTSLTLQKNGAFEPQDVMKVIGAIAVPLVFTLIFFISVMMSSGFLLEGVSEEKENRVIEVILSSISSDNLLLGKLIGLGGAGLLQVTVWFGMVLIPAAALLARLPIHGGAIFASFVFYLLGFLLFGTLLLGTGSLGQNLKESQQLGMVWSLFSVIPMMFMMIVLSEPNGIFPRVLSFFPLTAPVTMFLRLNSADPPPWWEVVLSAAVLAGSAWLALKVMAKIFRVGLLLYGKRPTIPEILRLVRRPSA